MGHGKVITGGVKCLFLLLFSYYSIEPFVYDQLCNSYIVVSWTSSLTTYLPLPPNKEQDTAQETAMQWLTRSSI